MKTRNEIADELMTGVIPEENYTENSEYSDHKVIADAIRNGDSLDDILNMQETNNWPETYFWVKSELTYTEPENLNQLFEQMKNDDKNLPKWDSLPIFGGTEPDSTIQIWSWDETRLIVGSCSDDIKIVTRKEYFGE